MAVKTYLPNMKMNEPSAQAIKNLEQWVVMDFFAYLEKVNASSIERDCAIKKVRQLEAKRELKAAIPAEG